MSELKLTNKAAAFLGLAKLLAESIPGAEIKTFEAVEGKLGVALAVPPDHQWTDYQYRSLGGLAAASFLMVKTPDCFTFHVEL